MTLQYALLGLVSSLGPVSGYDLMKMFHLSMTHYWHARHGQIYPQLEKMRRAGLVSVKLVEQRDRPNKKLYSITARGRRALVAWLRSERKPIQLKNESLLKTRFFSLLPRAEAVALMKKERAAHTALLERYRDLEKTYFSGGVAGCPNDDVMYAYFTLKRGIMFLEDSIAWCDWCLTAMRKREAIRSREPGARSRRSRLPRGKRAG